ncbi:hypothetical protein R3I94_002479 [Phoxinus phoxinus]
MPLEIVGVEATSNNEDDLIVLVVDLSYEGDAGLDSKLLGMKCGVKGVQLHGKMTVVLEPLMNDVTFIGAVTIYFDKKNSECLKIKK